MSIYHKLLKKFSLGSIVLFLSYTTAAFAQSTGIEVKSENFVLQGDVYEREAKILIKDLEIFRSSLFKMLGQEPRPEHIPVRVYAVKNSITFQDIVNNKTIGGVYKNTSQGAIFVLDAKGGVKPGDAARKIALHEYVHHITNEYTNQKFPRWYNEGYANFLANFKIKKSKFIIGAPDLNYASYLKRGSWMPMDAMIASVNRYPFISGSQLSSQRDLQNAFYAQSWLAVTFLQTNPEYARKSREYLERVNQGEDSVKAFTTAFGITPEEFQPILKKFLAKDYFLQYPFPLSKSEKSPALTIRKLTQSEYQSAILNAKIHFNK